MSNRNIPFIRWAATLVGALATFTLPSISNAASLQSLNWQAGTNETILELHLDGETDYKTGVFDDGMRMRVSLMDTTLGENVFDVSGRGIIKGAFPYISDDGNYVHIDILMHQPGELGISETDYGYQIISREPSSLLMKAYNISINLYEQGRYAVAERYAKVALKLGTEEFGPNDPSTADFLDNLAVLYQAQGRYAEAEPLYQRSLAIREKALGPEHPQVAINLENYGALLRQTGRAGEADRMEARAKAIRSKSE
ncbi:MAG: tetratricopeptide repeat protein [Gammaproteobacteria bacterium]|nr:tetratricopeptide repeat protein [Gammaproteobacteria bacterium]